MFSLEPAIIHAVVNLNCQYSYWKNIIRKSYTWDTAVIRIRCYLCGSLIIFFYMNVKWLNIPVTPLEGFVVKRVIWAPSWAVSFVCKILPIMTPWISWLLFRSAPFLFDCFIERNRTIARLPSDIGAWFSSVSLWGRSQVSFKPQ